ncbi:MAG TPA: alpha/beta hydrolase [Burkholderiales bacterium]|nr:alpha/beta hydrolase [Burkholderiales bacterium]
MPLPPPYFREAGSGPGVVCLHANASSSSQWRALMERLAPRFRVFAADSFGTGKSPPWPADRKIGLRDEAALLEPVFERAGEPFVLIGHSYGAAIALIAALDRPQRVRALMLYEPTLFSVLDAESPPPNEAEGIRAGVVEAARMLEAGDANAAAECFIDYWMGAGSWEAMPESRRVPILASIVNIVDWGRALFEEPTPLERFRTLNVPVLYMMGKETREPAKGVARLLTGALPQLEVVEFEGLGHMGPVTHPDIVNEVIAGFLERT